MKSSDYNSRHPESCSDEKCQICKFAFHMEALGDKVNKITVDDIEKGRIKMPFIQRSAWLKVQGTDKVHKQLSFLIDSSQSPERKRTKGDNTTLKRLHTLYKTGKLRKASDGLITVRHMDQDEGSRDAISVPTAMFPGLIQALHLKLDHPSKQQLQKLSCRYFYSPGFARIIDEVSTQCVVCASLKNLPKELFSESTVETPVFGGNFSSDVVKMHGQKILLTREKLSQFTITTRVEDETADSLRTALISDIIEFIPSSGSSVQVDNAPAWQSLSLESDSDGSIFKKLSVKIDLGRTLNKNKNPIAENAIKEFHKERLRIDPGGGPVTDLDLAIITKNMNSRIRDREISAKEFVFQRDQVTNAAKPVSDSTKAKEQFEKRIKSHPKIPLNPKNDAFKTGDNIFLKTDKNKLRGREMYKIIEIFPKQDELWANLQKSESQFRSKTYEAKLSELFLVPGIVAANVEEKTVDETSEPNPTNLEGKTASQIDNSVEAEEKSFVKETDVEENIDISEPTKRSKRKAAIESSKNIEHLISRGLLNVKVHLQKKPPNHAWDYDVFKSMMEEDDHECDYIKTRPKNQKENLTIFDMSFIEINDLVNSSQNIEENENSDAQESIDDLEAKDNDNVSELSWDYSPEQFDANFMNNNLAEEFNFDEDLPDFEVDVQKGAQGFSSPGVGRHRLLGLPSAGQLEDSDSLTSEASQEEVFDQYSAPEPPGKPANPLCRRNAIRRKAVKPTSSTPVLQTPVNPQSVCMNKKQILTQALPLHAPIAPETVHLGDDAAVQDLGQALLVLHDADGRHARGDNDDEDVCDEDVCDEDVRDEEDAHVEANVRTEEDTHDEEGNDEQGRRTEKVNYLTFHLYGQK